MTFNQQNLFCNCLATRQQSRGLLLYHCSSVLFIFYRTYNLRDCGAATHKSKKKHFTHPSHNVT